jgi:hypothetical protein
MNQGRRGNEKDETVNGEVVQQQATLNFHRQPLYRPHQRSVELLALTIKLRRLEVVFQLHHMPTQPHFLLELYVRCLLPWLHS